MKKLLVLLLAIGIVAGSIFLVRYLKEDKVEAVVVDATVTIEGQKIEIDGPGLLALDREDDFKDGYCYEINGFVFQNIDSNYIFDLFEISHVDRWKKHVVPIKLKTNNKKIVSLSAELGIIQEDKYVSIDEIGGQAGLDSSELKSLTEVGWYVNLNKETQVVLTYFTELVELSESEAFNKVLAVKPDSDLTLKISAKTEKKTIDFYFIFDAEEIHLAENN